jgi:hypothetical protein
MLKDHEEIKIAGEAAVAKAREASWWEWNMGSAIFSGDGLPITKTLFVRV